MSEEEPAEKPAETPEPPPGDDYTEQLAGAVNQFNGPIYADGAQFGIGPQRPARVKAAAGKLDDADVRAELSHYVTPAGYDTALGALRKDHVVGLHGDRGTGKRAGAIALLREVTDGPLYLLSPMNRLKSLAERDYTAGSGYIIADRIAERKAADVDFTWRTVRDRVRDQGAHLVVTTTTPTGCGEVDAVAHVRWEQPDPRQVLRVRLAGLDGADEVVERVLRAWPDGGQLTDLAAVAADLGEGLTVEEALPKLDASLHDRVRTWFDEERDERDFLAATALAFLDGARQRTFESALGKLAAKLAESVVGDEPDLGERPQPELLRQHRLKLYASDSLIKVERAGSDGVARHCPRFREPRYRRFVLAELWAREEAPFWDGVSAWLDEVMPEEGLRVAAGLAELARYAFDEVDDILAPWADGKRGWPGQTTATHVLWLLSYDEALAPEALQLAAQWAGRGTPAERWTGAVALSGELGARYPHEAANRLWQLILQSHTVTGDAHVALAALFVTLTRRTEDAGVVLTLLDGKVRRLDNPGTKPEYIRAATRATLSVLAARDRVSGRHAATTHLCRAGDRTAPVQGRLWAAVLRNRPTRKRALTVLRSALDDLKHLCDDPVAVATSLGLAISAALPPGEAGLLRADFAALEARTRKDSSPLVEHLLAAISHLHREAAALP
ncbi:hypothetical protein ACFVYA_01580 [Amycolatopsis sp. NPDC058278]|uniref:hypothetical protein n=1 Tax=Amycolatopsis sp. NPDC058278 TaxID=3346417 RepID=UPI0036DE60B6